MTGDFTHDLSNAILNLLRERRLVLLESLTVEQTLQLRRDLKTAIVTVIDKADASCGTLRSDLDELALRVAKLEDGNQGSRVVGFSIN